MTPRGFLVSKILLLRQTVHEGTQAFVVMLILSYRYLIMATDLKTRRTSVIPRVAGLTSCEGSQTLPNGIKVSVTASNDLNVAWNFVRCEFKRVANGDLGAQR